jgi:hypothetical protein
MVDQVKVYIENKVYTYDNENEKIPQIMHDIEKTVSDASKVISHMIIDGREVRNHFDEYLAEHISDIERIEVISKTYKELVYDILLSAMEYAENASGRIEILADEFYRLPDKNAWEQLGNFLGGIEWLINTFDAIDNDRNLRDIVPSYEDWNIYAKEIISLKHLLPEMEEALGSNDYVSIADILSYEIVPLFNSIKEKLSVLLEQEGWK